MNTTCVFSIVTSFPRTPSTNVSLDEQEAVSCVDHASEHIPETLWPLAYELFSRLDEKNKSPNALIQGMIEEAMAKKAKQFKDKHAAYKKELKKRELEFKRAASAANHPYETRYKSIVATGIKTEAACDGVEKHTQITSSLEAILQRLHELQKAIEDAQKRINKVVDTLEVSNTWRSSTLPLKEEESDVAFEEKHLCGVAQLVPLLCGVIVAFFPIYIDKFLDYWSKYGEPSEHPVQWPANRTAGIIPLPCHSHNDYWRRVPLFSAIQAGCIGVEADVWLFDNDLYVGHSKSSLVNNRTLANLYIKPLLDLLEKQNSVTHFRHIKPTVPKGVFDTAPQQTIVLLVDFKTKGHNIWPYLISQLLPLRDQGYLTHFNGTTVLTRPITVVATGNAPFELVTANSTYQDIFFDAPLSQLSSSKVPGIDTENSNSNSSYNFKNSYYASSSFFKSVGFPWNFRLSEAQRDIVRRQIKSAHDRGLKVRYWDTPIWPHFLRNRIWMELVREGADILNVDDLQSAANNGWLSFAKYA
ncbi:Altered inheritance of mitochondria protein 6 [Ophidiomyces ophidiicola]|nr:Altered inheritance of mitochondria protein 6 [Ophidiomyces ophidiicola]KAI1924451.1 Altered inheritance of mitochondria protein 6 [Ophidiomyces ophidiicola]KAI2003995.1 Altered inheritance of mitochondria protein 6 [Ophidiomyces ophidiicola]KAI2011676.1 Altered inheritance of mitochondria protein 6 [Ophidiomyces ophidiicola]KAI2014635.1 Altered inheritance of mitochondria protein 6 [Ophidiomyces ophidiicola]